MIVTWTMRDISSPHIHHPTHPYMAGRRVGWGAAHMSIIHIQWSPSYKATSFAQEKWPHKRGGLWWGGQNGKNVPHCASEKVAFREGWPILRGAFQEGDHCTALHQETTGIQRVKARLAWGGWVMRRSHVHRRCPSLHQKSTGASRVKL